MFGLLEALLGEVAQPRFLTFYSPTEAYAIEGAMAKETLSRLAEVIGDKEENGEYAKIQMRVDIKLVPHVMDAIMEIPPCECDRPECYFNKELHKFQEWIKKNEGTFLYIEGQLPLPQLIQYKCKGAEMLNDGFPIADIQTLIDIQYA